MRKFGRLVICLVVGFMSGLFGIAREVLGFWLPQKFPESRLLSASLVAACAISFGMAWWIENRDKRRIEAENRKIEERLNDRSPRVAFTVMSPSGNGWAVLGNQVPPPLFYLQHYGGDAARDVRVGPIVSPSGKRSLVFDPVNLVSGPVRYPVTFCVAMREKVSRGDRKLKDGETINQLMHFFLEPVINFATVAAPDLRA